MSRVLVTGGAGTLGAAVVRRLLRDPDFEVRVSDQREAPTWMREGCEIHAGDLRELAEARRAVTGCSHVVHVAAIDSVRAFPHTLLEVSAALSAAVIRAALDWHVERFVQVSSSAVYERAERTGEEQLPDCPPPRSAHGFAALAAEHAVRAAHEEHGLRFTICRVLDAPSRVDEVADGIVTAMAHPAGLNEDFNVAAGDELAVAKAERLLSWREGVTTA